MMNKHACNANMKPKTLAMRKMKKNFVAVQKKGYPQRPYEYSSIWFLIKRLRQEVNELERAITKSNFENASDECADISNMVDFIYERITQVGGKGS